MPIDLSYTDYDSAEQKLRMNQQTLDRIHDLSRYADAFDCDLFIYAKDIHEHLCIYSDKWNAIQIIDPEEEFYGKRPWFPRDAFLQTELLVLQADYWYWMYHLYHCWGAEYVEQKLPAGSGIQGNDQYFVLTVTWDEG